MKRKAVSGWQVVTNFLRGSLEENVSKGTLWSPVASVLFWPVNPLCCVDVFFWNWSARKKKGAKQADAKRRKAELRPHCWCWKARFLHRRPGHTKRVTMLCVCVCLCHRFAQGRTGPHGRPEGVVHGVQKAWSCTNHLKVKWSSLAWKVLCKVQWEQWSCEIQRDILNICPFDMSTWVPCLVARTPIWLCRCRFTVPSSLCV